MIKKLFKWFDKHKNEDSSLVQFLKLMYSIGQKSWIHTMISAILGIIIPILYEKDDYITFSMFIFFLFSNITDFFTVDRLLLRLPDIFICLTFCAVFVFLLNTYSTETLVSHLKTSLKI